MMTRRGVLQSGLFALATLALQRPRPAAAASRRHGIAGRSAPELNVDYWIDKNGEPASFRLADHEGKWVFLKCFQSWCPGCHSHGFPALKAISAALAGNRYVAFAGIQTVFEGYRANTVDKVREIQLQYDLQMPMGHDPGSGDERPRTMVDYRTGGTPWMILISPDRRVVFNDYSIQVEEAVAFLKKQTSS